MKISTALKKARRLITNPKRWTQGASARDAGGAEVDILNKNVRSFCAVGALCKAGGEGLTMNSLDLVKESDRFLTQALPRGYSDIISYNDRPGRRHAHILNWFDRAITRALKAES